MRKLPAWMVLLVATYGWSAERKSATELIDLAHAHSPDLRAAIEATFDEKQLKEGTAWIAHGPEAFFATEAVSEPKLMISDAAGPAMTQIPGSQLWYAYAYVAPVARLHSFRYLIKGESFGGVLDMPVFGPLSYLEPGVPQGTLLGPIEHTSKIYDGMKSQYWVYVPAQYDGQTSVAVMVFQDGSAYLDRNSNNPALNVIDNL